MITAILWMKDGTVSVPAINPGICNGNVVVLRHDYGFGSSHYAIEVERGDDPVERLSEFPEGDFLLLDEDERRGLDKLGWPNNEWFQFNENGDPYFVNKDVGAVKAEVMYDVPGFGLVKPSWYQSPEIYGEEGVDATGPAGA